MQSGTQVRPPASALAESEAAWWGKRVAFNDDRAFRKTYRWFRESVGHALAGSTLSAAQKQQVEVLLWKLMGLANADAQIPPDADPDNFQATGAAANSISVAALIVGESISIVDALQQAIAALAASDAAGKLEALKQIKPLVQSIEALADSGNAASKVSSAFGLGKMLLSLTGDAQRVAPVGELSAQNLGRLVAGLGTPSPSQARIANAAAATGLYTMVTGATIDRSFRGPSNIAAQNGWQIDPGLAALPPAAPGFEVPFELPAVPAPRGKVAAKFRLDPPPGVQVDAGVTVSGDTGLGTSGFAVEFAGTGNLLGFIPLDLAQKARVQGAGEVRFGLGKKKGTAPAVRLGPLGGPNDFGSVVATLDELGADLKLKNGEPAVEFYARGGKVTLTINDAFLKEVLSGDVSVDFSIVAEADNKGKLRLRDGTGLRVSLPVPKVPSGPFRLMLISFGVEPVGGSFASLDCELSASFGLDLGPFKAVVERLGVIAELRNLFGNSPELGFRLKPPSGAGMSLDVGVVKGGGYLFLDPGRGEYAGALELKIAQIGVKALAILTTKSPAGWSLLLMIFGNFPPIQLSWGFTLTGIGGLIGLQHTASTDALSQGLASGALDAVLFPADPVGDAPQIIATLRQLFPIKRGGFVIGPMLEVGWGTPNLVTIRAGVLIEASQIVILGQAIVQLPPLIDKDLAILRLQVDFVGYIIFDPFKLGFDGRLRDSRVLVITLTGSFAFRAAFGDKPTFLLSAGGFHPRFKDVPPDVPKMDRIGAGFSIGIIGVSVKGYFAITSATVQAGFELGIWGDVGVASFEAGFGFDAICYLEPRFYFEIDMRAYASVAVFGIDLCGVRIHGLLAGPGRWRAAGSATLDLGLLGEYDFDFDESWGTAPDTPSVRKNAGDLLLAEIRRTENWAAQLPADGESYVTLARVEGFNGVLAHPRSPLTFHQKLLPLGKQLARLGVAKIDGADRFDLGSLTIGGAAAAGATSTVRDFFAAAQFFAVKEEDRLKGPSFEAFDAGATISADDYADVAGIDDALDYEEVNLSAQSRIRSGFHLGLLASGKWIAKYGAAGRSVLRADARINPAEAAKIAVNPPAYAVAGKEKLAATNTAAGYWSSMDVLASAGRAQQLDSQVVEAFELMV